MAILKQYDDADLEWVAYDAVSLQFTVLDVTWGTVFDAQIRSRLTDSAGQYGVLLDTFDVEATVDGADLAVELTLPAGNGVPAGNWFWGLRDAGGITRLAGQVRVQGTTNS